MVNSPYYLHCSTMYPKTVDALNESKRAAEHRIVYMASTASLPSKSWPGSAGSAGSGQSPGPLQIPDPETSTYMHLRHGAPILSSRPKLAPPVRYETMIGAKSQYGLKAMQDNVWQKEKVKGHAKAIKMRGDCQKGELFGAQKEIQNKILGRYPTMIAAFRAADIDRGGTLTRQEVKALFKTLRIMVREVALDTLLDVVDTDEGGTLDYKEFARVLTCTAEELEMIMMGDSGS